MSLKCSAAHRSPELWNFKEMSKYLEKFSILRKIIKANGGLKGSFLQLYRWHFSDPLELVIDFARKIVTKINLPGLLCSCPDSFARERTQAFDYVENLKSKKALHSEGLWQKENCEKWIMCLGIQFSPMILEVFVDSLQARCAWHRCAVRTDELKIGDLVGEDKYGNKYYQNKYYFVGRSRWVQYADKVNMDYDASQIPAEWHRWLHYSTDDPPTKVPPVAREWIEPHTENMSATPQEYVPYSTTRPKIESWIPPRKC